MNVWSEVFLGVIAVATLAMAIAQVGVLIAASILATRRASAPVSFTPLSSTYSKVSFSQGRSG